MHLVLNVIFVYVVFAFIGQAIKGGGSKNEFDNFVNNSACVSFSNVTGSNFLCQVANMFVDHKSEGDIIEVRNSTLEVIQE